MARSDQLLLIYLELARASLLRNQALVCDKLLLLGGVAALDAGWEEIADGCRAQILRHNPQHLIRRWPDLATASGAERFDTYLKQLRRKYSPEKAEHMLNSLGLAGKLPPSNRSDQEYARTLLSSLAVESAASPQEAKNKRASAAGNGAERKTAGDPRKARKERRPPAAAGTARRSYWWPFWLALGAWAALAAAALLAWLGHI